MKTLFRNQVGRYKIWPGQWQQQQQKNNDNDDNNDFDDDDDDEDGGDDDDDDAGVDLNIPSINYFW